MRPRGYDQQTVDLKVEAGCLALFSLNICLLATVATQRILSPDREN